MHGHVIATFTELASGVSVKVCIDEDITTDAFKELIAQEFCAEASTLKFTKYQAVFAAANILAQAHKVRAGQGDANDLCFDVDHYTAPANKPLPAKSRGKQKARNWQEESAQKFPLFMPLHEGKYLLVGNCYCALC